MINKKQIAEMAKNVFKHERGLRDPRIMHPDREWLLGLGAALVVFVVGAVWSGNTFLKNRHVSALTAQSDGVTETVYRESQVKEVLKTLDERERRLQELLGVAPEPLPVEAVGAYESVTEVATSTTEEVEFLPAQDIEGNIPQLGD
jgi:hypothetical protein